MRRLLAAAAGLTAAATIAGCGSVLHGDIDIGSAILGTVNNNEIVVANVAYKVNATPRSFEAVIDLDYRKGNTGSWTTEAEHIIRLADLPDPGDSGTTPNLVAFCIKGTWRVRMHVYGVSHDGTASDNTYYFPGPSSTSNGKPLC